MPTRRTALRRTLLAGMGLGGAALVGTEMTPQQASADSALLADLKALVAKYDPSTPTPTPTVAPTPTPTAVPTPTATVAPPSNIPRGFSNVVHGREIDEGWTNWTRSMGMSIVGMSFVYDQHRTRDLEQWQLDQLRRSLAAVKAANMHALVRFSYWYHDIANPSRNQRVDALPAQVERHMQQLAPIVNEYRDAILVMKAGFAGLWGEWHYHEVPSQFHTYGERNLNQPNPNRRWLVEKLLQYFRVPIAFRYPRDIRWMWGFLNESQNAQIAHHNDAILTGPNETGTWDPGATAGETDEQWMYRVYFSQPRIVGGEFADWCDYSDGQLRTAFTSLARRQYRFHSWNSGVGPDAPKARLERLGLWDDLVRGVEIGW